MWFMAIMAAAGVASSLLQMRNQQQMTKINADRAKKAAEWDAADRREELRRTLAAQRVLAVAQGSNPDVGSAQVLGLTALRDSGKDTERAAFNQAGEQLGYKNQYLTAALNGVSGVSDSLLSYYKSRRETTGVPNAPKGV